MTGDALSIGLAGVFGLLFGSFLNAVIYRVPLGISLLRPSGCPGCEESIAWHHNVPVLAWIALRARCANCGTKISLRYPLVELAGGLLLAASVAQWGLTVSAFSVGLFSYLMLVLALIDVDHRILPNVITLPGAVIGLALAFVDPRVAWLDSLIGGFLGGGLLYFVAWGYLKLRGREGMGMGDVKMMLLVGSFLGWQGALMTIFIGSLLGSVVGVALISLSSRKGWQYALPFGTFLAAAGILVAFRGTEIFQWYWATFGVAP
ncbi:MAG: prepilin peptidase [Acidobacteria bacterium]|nr:prepilin peptidase [Acidobacteriota bacterium]